MTDPDHNQVLLKDGVKEAEEQRLFFIFFDGKEAYAVHPDTVVEVATKIKPTQVPFTPDWVEGVVCLRGEIVPVLDLDRYFRFANVGTKQRNRIILLELEGNFFAVWSDRIHGVENIDESVMEPPLGNLPDSLLKCMAGQFRLKDVLVYYLDLPKLLEETRMQVGSHQA